MKNLITLLFFTIFSVTLFSQAPALIPYQAIARNAAGEPLASSTLNARFTLHDITVTGTVVWQELQTVSTSALGLFTAQLGSSVSLAGVNWATGSKFMQVELDLGNGFVDIGTQQLMSVPYALYSGEAQNAQNATNSQTAGNGISGISLTGDTLYLSNGTYVIVPGISAANGPAQVPGCTSNTACNYNSSATQDDGSCYFIGSPCNDGNSSTFSDVYNASCVCEGSTGTIGAAHSCGAQNVHNANLTYGSMTDQQGNIYKTIVIGTQEWMAENLNTSIYRNGDAIPTGLSNSQWSSTTQGAWAYYNNDASYVCPYGKLYNWYACVDARGLCPTGWHVPSDAEWTDLTTFLGGESVAGGAMKSTGTIEAATGLWFSPNAGATNSSGFSGLPGGYRNYYDGGYDHMGDYGFWWSSSQYDSLYAWYRKLDYGLTDVDRSSSRTRNGWVVRCLRD